MRTSALWQLLERHFQSLYPDLLDHLKSIASRLVDDEQAILQEAEAYLDTIFTSFKVSARFDFKRVIPLLEDRLAGVRHNLKVERKLFKQHTEKKASLLDKLTDPKQPLVFSIVYTIFYLALIVAAGAVFSAAFPYVFPEQNRITGIAMAALIPAPSFLATHWCRRRSFLEREKVLSAILLFSGLACLSMFLFFGISKHFAARVMSTSAISAQTLFANQPAFNLTELIYQASSFLAFITSFIAEAGFAASLAILLYHYIEKPAQLKELDRQLTASCNRQQDLEDRETAHHEEIQHSQMEDELLETWCDFKRHDLLIEFQSLLDDAKADVGDQEADLAGEFGALPFLEKKRLMRGNGNGKHDHTPKGGM